MAQIASETIEHKGAATNTPSHVGLLCGIVAMAIGLHILRLFREPWLDEYGTSWITSGNWMDLHNRGSETLPDARLFYIFSWLIQKITGETILAVRIPSLIVSLAASLLVGLIGRRLFGKIAGYYASIILIIGVHSPILFEDARPYSLAVFISALSTLCFLTWTEQRRMSYALLYGVLSASVMYCHLLFSLLIPCHLLWLLCRHSTFSIKERNKLLVQVAIAGVSATVCCVPLLRTVSAYSTRANHLSFLSHPTFFGLLFAAIPIEIFCALAAVVASFILFQKRIVEQMIGRQISSHIIGLILWMIIPPCILTIAGFLSDCPVLLPRYFAHQAIPAALLASWIIDRLGSALPLRSLTLTPFILLLAFHSLRVYSNLDEERWQAALSENAKTSKLPCPLLLQPGLVESQQSELYSDPLWYGYLTQLATYSGLPIKPVLVPYSFVGQRNLEYLENVITPLIRSNSCVSMVYRSASMKLVGLKSGAEPTPAVFQIADIVRQYGYSPYFKSEYGFVRSIVWERNSG
jgi:4-amino-4-deoxy-L-arabinose transferase-like glycosyltransferase